MTTVASQMTSLTVGYSIVYSGADQRKHQSSASLAFVRGFTGTGEFPAQRANKAENGSILWRYHVMTQNLSVDKIEDLVYKQVSSSQFSPWNIYIPYHLD